MVTAEDGALAVRLARAAVARALGASQEAEAGLRLPSSFRERRGVFVSWYEHPLRRLRGCVGYPRPVLPLAEGVRGAAIAAALDDPRFPPVAAAELAGLVAEVSVLTPFEPVAIADRPGGIRVGRDGLVVERGSYSGLLLPQVAPEQGWDSEAFLDGTCEKAGLEPDAWRSPHVAVYRFEAEVYRETRPGGEVVVVPLSPSSRGPGRSA